jgi:hypothetical protein
VLIDFINNLVQTSAGINKTSKNLIQFFTAIENGKIKGVNHSITIPTPFCRLTKSAEILVRTGKKRTLRKSVYIINSKKLKVRKK